MGSQSIFFLYCPLFPLILHSHFYIQCPIFSCVQEVCNNRPGYNFKRMISTKYYSNCHILKIYLSWVKLKMKMMMVNWCDVRDLHFFITLLESPKVSSTQFLKRKKFSMRKKICLRPIISSRESYITSSSLVYYWFREKEWWERVS